MQHNKNNFGDFLRELRQNKSLRSFAQELGVSHTLIDRLEKGIDSRNGKPYLPSHEFIRLIVLKFNLSYEAILRTAGMEEDMNLFLASANAKLDKGLSSLESSWLDLVHKMTLTELTFIVAWHKSDQKTKQSIISFFNESQKVTR